MANIKIISEPWGKYRPPLTDEEIRARGKKEAEEHAKNEALWKQKNDEYKQKIENIFHFQRQDEIRRNVIKLLSPFKYTRSGCAIFLYDTYYHGSHDHRSYEDECGIKALVKYKEDIDHLSGTTLKKLGLGLDRFACDKLVYDSRLNDKYRHLLFFSDDIDSIEQAIDKLIGEWNFRESSYFGQEDEDVTPRESPQFCREYCVNADGWNRYLDFDYAYTDYVGWIVDKIMKDLLQLQNKFVDNSKTWGYDYYLKSAKNDLDFMVESLKVYGDLAFDVFVTAFRDFERQYGNREPYSLRFGTIDPNVVFTLAKLKENGYKNLIERNQEEADLFYRISFLTLTANRFRKFSARISQAYILTDISPLYKADYCDNRPDYLLFFNIEEFLKKYESLEMGRDFRGFSNRLLSAANNYEKKHRKIKNRIRDYGPFGFYSTPDPNPLFNMLNGEDFPRWAALLLEQEVIYCFGTIFFQRKEYEKARECFGKALDYEEFYAGHEFSLDDNGEINLLCNLAFVELAMGRVHHKFSKDGSHCQRLNFDLFESVADSSLNDAYARLDFIKSYYPNPLPIMADFFFYANVVNEDNYQYPRDVYICCYLNTMRGEHYPFECIGWSLFDHPNSSRENIAEICDIIHHKKTRDEQDEVFLRFFDGNHDETHKSKRKKYCSLRMKPLSSSRYKQINIHKKKERKNVYETN